MANDLGPLRGLLNGPLDYVVVCPAYPGTGRNGGEFIRTRVQAYAAAGLRGAVIEVSTIAQQPSVEEQPSGTVIRVPEASIDDVVDLLAATDYPVLAHSPSPAAQELLRLRILGNRLVIWFHGYEVRDHRRLFGNYSGRDAPGYALLFRPPQPRMEVAAATFRDPSITKVFVSEFQLHASEVDVGVATENAVVIPNHIDVDLFRGRVREPEEARSILLMRSFRARNYGNDIGLRALEHVSRRCGFSELRVTVKGFGPLFRTETAALRPLQNVEVIERYSTPVEMAVAHADHGVFLCPSRYDTQGVMLGEAMASGMVCISNRVAAIPEFADDSCSLLVKPDDPRAFAEAIWALVQQPEVMPVLSRNATARARLQCGYGATIARELQLIRRGGHA